MIPQNIHFLDNCLIYVPWQEEGVQANTSLRSSEFPNRSPMKLLRPDSGQGTDIIQFLKVHIPLLSAGTIRRDGIGYYKP